MAIGLGRGAGILALALVAGACSSGGHGEPRAGETEVVLRDFAIEAPQAMDDGEVTFHVENHGPETHEMVVVRGDEGDLTFRADGVTVDEDELEPITLGEVEDLDPGTTEDWTVDLDPGEYVLFCNMSGHFLGGMYTELVVR